MLTIAIPTYNRASHLEHLLHRLLAETGAHADVLIIILDNCSTDATAQVAQRFEQDGKVRYVRNSSNVGVDRNIAKAFALAQSEYVWICGDDDAPLPGCVAAMLHLLHQSQPDLLFIPSIWQPDIRGSAGAPIVDTDHRLTDALSFARQVNVWVTFISGMIVRKSLFLEHFDDTYIERLQGTNFIQLAWVLGNLRAGKIFAIANSPWLLATSGNSGGYAVLETFLHKLVQVTETMLGQDSRLSRAILGRVSVGYLPQLTYNLRFRGRNFDTTAALQAIRGADSALWAACLFLPAIAGGPQWLARCTLYMTRLAAAAQRRFDLLRSTRPKQDTLVTEHGLDQHQ